jgi:hypothetical protein
MPDIFSYDIIEAFQLPGCPVCRAVVEDERRWMESFWREGRQDAGARRRFFEAGGFCRSHAWLLHRYAAQAGSGAVITDLYGWLATYDLRWFDATREKLDGRRKRPKRLLGRRRRCPACLARDEADNRKVDFLLEALNEPEVRAGYSRSEGLCFAHLSAAMTVGAAGENSSSAVLLLDDWRHRLQALRAALAEYDRKRDHRYATEPKGLEQDAWTDVIRLYVGEPPA